MKFFGAVYNLDFFNVFKISKREVSFIFPFLFNIEDNKHQNRMKNVENNGKLFLFLKFNIFERFVHRDKS